MTVADCEARLVELQPMLEEAAAIKAALLLDYLVAEGFISHDDLPGVN